MLMEVSTPGRKLKPPSSIKAGSSCPCTITLAPVTVDSRGMKSFCSVRSVRDRPEDAAGEELGMETHALTLAESVISWWNKAPRVDLVTQSWIPGQV